MPDKMVLPVLLSLQSFIFVSVHVQSTLKLHPEYHTFHWYVSACSSPDAKNVALHTLWPT